MLLWRLQQYIRGRRKRFERWRSDRAMTLRFLGKACPLYRAGRPMPGVVVEVGLRGFRFRDINGKDRYVPLWEARNLDDDQPTWLRVAYDCCQSGGPTPTPPIWARMQQVLAPAVLRAVSEKHGLELAP